MFVSMDGLRDPCPELADPDLSGLVWEDSADFADFALSHDDADWDEGWGRPSGVEDSDPALRAWGEELASLVEAEQLAADAAALTGSLAGWTDRGLVAELSRLERLSRYATARTYQLTQELAARRPGCSGDPDEAGLSAYALDEVAMACGVARGVARARVAEAEVFSHRHPRTLAALAAGLVTAAAARRVVEATIGLEAEGCATVEERLLNRLGRPIGVALGQMTPVELWALPTDLVLGVSARATTAYVGRAARDLTDRVDPDASARRRERARAGRGVSFEPGSDGLAWLTAHAPAARAAAAYERVDQLARALPDSVDGPDPRTLAAKRADVMIDLLLGHPVLIDSALTDTALSSEAAPVPVPVPVNLEVIIDVTGDGDGGVSVGELAGVGRVCADTVRDLLDLAESSGGAVTGGIARDQSCPGQAVHDRDGPGPYQPPEALKRLIRVRHRRCVFPGCARSSRRCHLDHSKRYPDGPTCVCNLAPLCEHHHLLKHHAPGWHLHNHADGTLTWTTPTRRCIRVGTIAVTLPTRAAEPDPALDPPPF